MNDTTGMDLKYSDHLYQNEVLQNRKEKNLD